MTAPRQFMLDTNIASFIVKGASAALQAKLRAHPIADTCISSITQGELLFGLARRPEASAIKTAVHGLLQLVEVLPWDSSAAEAYGVLRANLERQGQSLGNLDTLIAAHAIATGSVLVTNDKALIRTPGLEVEDWSTE